MISSNSTHSGPPSKSLTPTPAQLRQIGRANSRIRTQLNISLVSAVMVGNMDLARRLLAAGARAEGARPAPEQSSWNAGAWIVGVNSAVLQTHRERLRERQFMSPLMATALHADPVDLIELLLAHGAQPAGSGRGAMRYAAMRQNLRAMEELVRRGADPGRGQTSAELTPLHDAARMNRCDSIEHLVALGANPDIRAAAFGVTPLHVAVGCNQAAACAALLEAGADPDAQDAIGRGVTETVPPDRTAEARAVIDAHRARQAMASCAAGGGTRMTTTQRLDF